MSGGAWSEIAGKLAERFEVAAAIGGHASYNATGCAAMAKVIKEMGHKLDIAVARDLASKPAAETAALASEASLDIPRPHPQEDKP